MKWICFTVFAAHAVVFLVANFRNDVQGMVFFGFLGALWLHLAQTAPRS